MDLNSIVFTGLFIVVGGFILVISVSFIAYKIRNKQTYKIPVQNYQPQEFFPPMPAPVPVQSYQTPVQQPQYPYNINQ